MFSYAQNFEDVILARCFAGKTAGFYIDVGANDPIIHSVTKHFYALGWRGINIEPSDEYYPLVCNDRPEDINLKCAVSSSSGEIKFFEFAQTGLSTADENAASEAKARGYQTKEIRVTAKTLDSIIFEHQVAEVDFLKIDVEGFEADVIAGFSFTVRPKILIIEVNKPLTQSIVDLDWEPKVLEHGYRKVYYDGLNNFYLDLAYYDLYKQHFELPPNIFDLQMTYAEEVLPKLAMIKQLDQDKQAKDLQISQLIQQNAELHQQLVAVYSSFSWRITRPLRAVKGLLEFKLSLAKLDKIKALPKRIISQVLKKIARIGIVKRVGKKLLNRHPWLKLMVKRKMAQFGLLQVQQAHSSFKTKLLKTPQGISEISAKHGEDVAQIYALLTKEKTSIR